MKTIRWGIIGCGNVTEVKSGPAFQKIEGSSLVAVMRRDTALARDYAERHGVSRWYDNAQALIDDTEVDAIYIATPHGNHLEHVEAAAAAGKPVYVEKPMGCRLADSEQMVKTCEKAEVPLFVAFYRRALAPFLQVKQWIDSDSVGTIVAVRMMLAWPPQRWTGDKIPWRLDRNLGGGLLYDLASHQLDLLDFLIGPVAKVEGFAAKITDSYPTEDTATASLVFENGALGSCSWSFAATAPGRDRTEIVGTKATISFSTFLEESVELRKEDGIEEFPGTFPQHVQQPLIETIVSSLRGTGPCPSTGASALRTARVLDAIRPIDLKN